MNSSRPSLESYVRLLLKWNKTYRLVGENSPDEVWNHHMVDISPLSGQLGFGVNIVDLGSGAGLPSIPLKIIRPDLSIILVEAQRKRVAFCKEAIRHLGLAGISVIHGRVEDPVVRKSVGAVDAVVSRATWKLKQYLSVAQMYVYIGAKIVSLKGAAWGEEFPYEDIMSPNIILDAVVPYSVVETRRERAILVLKVV